MISLKAQIDRPANKSTAVKELLTGKVRVVTDRQLARYLFAGNLYPLRSARDLLHALKAKGDAEANRHVLNQELPLRDYVSRWEPGDPPPHHDRLAWQIRSRWNGPSERVLVARATKKARILTGGLVGERPLRADEITHDVHVTALYLKFHAENPERAASWVHEDELLREGGARDASIIPDALVVGPTAIEFAGRYSAAKLASIHRRLSQQQLAYEIW